MIHDVATWASLSELLMIVLIQLLVYENPASRPVFVAFPNPVFKLE